MQKYRKQIYNENEQKRREELAKLYEPDWKECEEIQGWSDSIDDPLGSLDGDVEWSNDIIGAHKRFLPINAYVRFIDPKNIVLVGRTGTGKSSILFRYEYAINTQEVQDYAVAMTIRFDRLFSNLEKYNFNDGQDEVYQLRDIYDIVIRLNIINFFIQKRKENAITDIANEDYNILKKFMNNTSIGTRKNVDVIQKICNELDSLRVLKEDLFSLENVAKHVRDIYNVYQEDVNDVLERLLLNNKMLVLVDSLDKYDITSKKIVVMSKALFECAIDMDNKRLKDNYALKVAVPSEIFAHVSSAIPVRKKTKVVVIDWSFRDLIRMLAMKVFFCFNDEKYVFAKKLNENYTIEDFKDYNTALDYLHGFLPCNCPAVIPVSFKTISYCFKHTQKKPRQVMMIFNSLIHKMYIEKSCTYYIDNPDEIGCFVHKAQEDLISDALNMYNVYTDNKLTSIVSEVLCREKNFLTNKEFMNAIRGASKEYTKVGLTDEDVKAILIESGLVGKAYRERYVEQNDDFFHNTTICKVVLAQFEYQVKEKLITKGCTYVLHPMCYERFENVIDINAWVYPEPADDTEDDIISSLEKKRIII